jgi:hypothetical protein
MRLRSCCISIRRAENSNDEVGHKTQSNMSLSILVVVCRFNSFTFCGLCFSTTRECVDEPEKIEKGSIKADAIRRAALRTFTQVYGYSPEGYFDVIQLEMITQLMDMDMDMDRPAKMTMYIHVTMFP